jgi:tetratricopeptide (TPR) repeat protein
MPARGEEAAAILRAVDGTAMRCPQCGAEVGGEARFCAQCGVRLGGLVPTADARRRRHARLPPRVERDFGADEIDAAIEVDRDGTWVAVESALMNVSRGGLGLVCDEPLEVGGRVRATLLVDGPPADAEGVVVYCAPFDLFAGVSCYRCGVAFDHPQARFVQALAGPSHGAGYLVSLGDVAVEQGDRAAARRWYEEALALYDDLDEQERIPRILESLAILAALADDSTRALRLAGAASALRESLGVAPTPAQQARIDGALGAVRWGLNEDAAQTAWAAGRALDLEQAIAEALSQGTPGKEASPSDPPGAQGR